MSYSKKLWVPTAAILIVIVAGVAGFLLWAPAAHVAGWQVVWTTSGVAAGTPGMVAGAAPLPENSGIENIYICDNLAPSAFLGVNLATETTAGKLLDGAEDPVITGNGDTATIPYEIYYRVVVAVKIRADASYTGNKAQAKLIAYVNPDNMAVELQSTGSINWGPENSIDGVNEVVFENNVPFQVGASNPTGYARVNCVFPRTNDSYWPFGFKLPAGGTQTLTAKLWIWS